MTASRLVKCFLRVAFFFTYNVTGLSAFTKYKLEITAINLGGEGATLTKEDEDTTTAQDSKTSDGLF